MSYQTNGHIRNCIDNYLFQLAQIESNMGTDSTETEKLIAKNEKDCIIKRIRNLDEQYYQDVFNIK